MKRVINVTIKRKFIIFISLGIILLIYLNFFYSARSFEERVCNEIVKFDNDCEKIYHVDLDSKIIFYKNNSGIMFARTDDNLLDVVEVHGKLSSELIGSSSKTFEWLGNSSSNFSIIWGFHRNEIRTILINSENNTQPNRIKIGENLWLWYSVFNKDELNMPIKVTAYDNEGKIIKK